jgi:hypothetical protein
VAQEESDAAGAGLDIDRVELSARWPHRPQVAPGAGPDGVDEPAGDGVGHFSGTEGVEVEFQAEAGVGGAAAATDPGAPAGGRDAAARAAGWTGSECPGDPGGIESLVGPFGHGGEHEAGQGRFHPAAHDEAGHPFPQAQRVGPGGMGLDG